MIAAGILLAAMSGGAGILPATGRNARPNARSRRLELRYGLDPAIRVRYVAVLDRQQFVVERVCVSEASVVEAAHGGMDGRGLFESALGLVA